MHNLECLGDTVFWNVLDLYAERREAAVNSSVPTSVTSPLGRERRRKTIIAT